MAHFNDTQPIFVQIRQRVVALILNGTIKEGEAVPSIRQVAMDLEVNPLTVTKAYQTLADSGVIEKKRGLGMFVKEGARDQLLSQEREAFLAEEWPRIRQQIAALGLSLKELMQSDNKDATK